MNILALQVIVLTQLFCQKIILKQSTANLDLVLFFS